MTGVTPRTPLTPARAVEALCGGVAADSRWHAGGGGEGTALTGVTFGTVPSAATLLGGIQMNKVGDGWMSSSKQTNNQCRTRQTKKGSHAAVICLELG